MDKKVKALEYFSNRFNCSQAVFAPYAKENGISEELALKISTSFGAGMGRCAKTCGAVTGALMVIGLINGKFKSDDLISKDRTYNLTKKFIDTFTKKHTSTECVDLLKMDISNDAEFQEAIDKNIFKDVCPIFVESAVQILDEIL